MTQAQGSSSTKGGRIDGSIGTAAVAGDFVLGAGWGTTPILAILAGSNDQRGQLTITADATPAQATATITHTFSDGAFAAAPLSIAVSTNDEVVDTGHVLLSTSTTTTATHTYQILPVDTSIYIVRYVNIA